MRHFQRIAEGVDVVPILAELEAAPDLWDSITLRKTAPDSPHTGMSDIWVRYNDVAPFIASGSFQGLNDPHVPINYPAWYALPSLQDFAFRLMACVRGEMLGGVLITRIAPGRGINMHTDHGWHVDYFSKFYLSLKSAPGAQFICQPEGEPAEVLEPTVGDVWYFDNRRPHAVVNGSEKDRMTAIFCIRTTLFQ